MMSLYLFLISLTFNSFSIASTQQLNRNQNFQQYELQTFQTTGPASPLANIIGAIAAPLNVLADRLTRNPQSQQFGPYGPSVDFGPPGHNGPHSHYGPPGHHGPPSHHGHPGHHGPPGHYGPPGHHGFHHSVPSPLSLNPFLPYSPPRDNIDNMQMHDFSHGQNYPKPGFSRYPGNRNNNGNGYPGNINNNGNFQPQPPRNQYSNTGFENNNFGGFANNVQNNGFGGIGSNGNQYPPTSSQTNQFNNDHSGVSTDNGLGQNQPSQENALIQSTFGNFGFDPNRSPQSQHTDQFGNNFGGATINQQSVNTYGTQETNSGVDPSTFQKPQTQNQPLSNNGLISSTFGGFPENPQTNDPSTFQKPQTQNQHLNNNGLISSTFGGFPENPQTNNKPASTNPSDSDSIITSIFGDSSTQRPPNVNPSSDGDENGLVMSTFAGFGPDGIPFSPAQGQTQTQTANPITNNKNDLISTVFGGLPQQPNTNDANDLGNSAQIPNQSNSGDLVVGVFEGFDNLQNSKDNFPTNSETNGETKANKDSIESIFVGNDNIGTSTAPPSTTNSNGLIYDIDVRSS